MTSMLLYGKLVFHGRSYQCRAIAPLHDVIMREEGRKLLSSSLGLPLGEKKIGHVGWSVVWEKGRLAWSCCTYMGMEKEKVAAGPW